MDVEATAKDGGPRPWLVPLHRWLAVLAWIVGGALVFFVVLNYALTPLYDVFAPGHMDAFADVVVLSSSVLWWILVTTSGLAAVLLVVCWPKDELPARRALALIGAGLVAYWPWKLLDGWLDLWGIRSPAEATPEIVRLATVDAILSQTITVVSACLMIAGAVRVNRGALKLDPRKLIGRHNAGLRHQGGREGLAQSVRSRRSARLHRDRSDPKRLQDQAPPRTQP